MNNNDRDLKIYGEEFQFRLLKLLIDDHKFFRELYPILNQNAFTKAEFKQIVGTLKDMFGKDNFVPSYELLGIQLSNFVKSEQEKEIINEYLLKIKDSSTEGVEYIQSNALSFFKQQNLIKLTHEMMNRIKNNQIEHFEEFEEKIRKAINIGIESDMGEDIYTRMDEVLKDNYRQPIPTGMTKIDEYLQGGLGKGELGLVIAPSGSGKTSMSTAMASHASTFKSPLNDNKGFNVVQIFFEDSYDQIIRKHYGNITGIEAKDLSKEGEKEIAVQAILSDENKAMKMKNLRLKRFPSGEKSVIDIKHYLKSLINSGFTPDLVIIDYFECIKGTAGGSENEWKAENRTMRQLETMAAEFKIALWVPTQGTKDSLSGKNIVTMDKAGGSVGKIQISHVVLSISRMMGDMTNNKAIIGILKNRAGVSDIYLNGIEFNNGTCRINTDNAVEFNSFEEYSVDAETKNLQDMKMGMSNMVNMKKK